MVCDDCGKVMNLWFDKFYRCPNCGRKEGGEDKNDNNKRQEGDHGVVEQGSNTYYQKRIKTQKTILCREEAKRL